MNQINLHILCDILLLIPLLGILISLLFLSNTLKDDVFIIKQIFDGWNNKPIQILQESYMKTCSEIGMFDILSYDWPGTIEGCFCQNSKKLFKNSCEFNKLNSGGECINIPENKFYTSKKWKGSFLCGSSIKPKNYFDLNIVSKNERCSNKYKKCGIIDTLDNYLCIPENELCPLNKIDFMKGIDSLKFDTSNHYLNGKIFSSFKIAEKTLCLNNNQRFFTEKDHILINTYLSPINGVSLSMNDSLEGCFTGITDLEGKFLYTNPNYIIIDSDSKFNFYEKNEELFHTLNNIPNYLDSYSEKLKLNENTIYLYASVYPGWKNQCDRKEFKAYLKSSKEKEILYIFEKTEENEKKFLIYSFLALFLFAFGIGYMKYSIFIKSYNKFEYSISASAIISLFYIGILSSNFILLYLADYNLDFIKNAKVSTNFFELIINNKCSDDITDASLKHVAKQFFSFANKYFNIKLLSFLVLFSGILNCLITFIIRHSGESFSRKNYYKKRNV
jgi:hypothetical protein